MSFSKKFMKMLASLDEEDKQTIRSMLDGESTEPQQDTSPVAETTAEVDSVATDDVASSETKSAEERVDDKTVEQELLNETSTNDDAITDSTMEEPVIDDTVDEVPPFDASAPKFDEEATEPPQAEQLQATDGTDIPVDYKSIVDAQNARIMALEAENSNLKADKEGAFGYSMKPSSGVKVNPLYGDTSDLRFKK